MIGGWPLDRAVEVDLADPGEADAGNGRGGALQDRRVAVDRDAHADEFGLVGHQHDCLDLPHRHAGERHRGAFGEAVDRLLEEDVEFLRVAARKPRQPDGEDQHRREKREDDAADKDVVRAGFHGRQLLAWSVPLSRRRPVRAGR